MKKQKLTLRVMVIQNGNAILNEILKFNKVSGKYEWKSRGGIKFQEEIVSPKIIIGTIEEKLMERERQIVAASSGYAGFPVDCDDDRFAIRVRITRFQKNFAAFDIAVLQKPPKVESVLPEAWK